MGLKTAPWDRSSGTAGSGDGFKLSRSTLKARWLRKLHTCETTGKALRISKLNKKPVNWRGSVFEVISLRGPTYGLRVPSRAASLEPAQVATQRGGDQNCIWVLFKLFIRKSLVDGNLKPGHGQQLQA